MHLKFKIVIISSIMLSLLFSWFLIVGIDTWQTSSPFDAKDNIGEYKLYPMDDGIAYELCVAMDKDNALERCILNGIVDYTVSGDYLLMLTMNMLRKDESLQHGANDEYWYGNKQTYWILNYKIGEFNGPMDEQAFYQFKRQRSLSAKYLKVPKCYWKRCCQL